MGAFRLLSFFLHRCLHNAIFRALILKFLCREENHTFNECSLLYICYWYRSVTHVVTMVTSNSPRLTIRFVRALTNGLCYTLGGYGDHCTVCRPWRRRRSFPLRAGRESKMVPLGSVGDNSGGGWGTKHPSEYCFRRRAAAGHHRNGRPYSRGGAGARLLPPLCHSTFFHRQCSWSCYR